MKAYKADITRSQEMLKQAVSRAPLVQVPVSWGGEEDVIEIGDDGHFEAAPGGSVSGYSARAVVQGPDMPRA